LRDVEDHKVSDLLQLLREPARIIDTAAIILGHVVLLLFLFLLLFGVLIIAAGEPCSQFGLLSALLGLLSGLLLLNLNLDESLLDDLFRLWGMQQSDGWLIIILGGDPHVQKLLHKELVCQGGGLVPWVRGEGAVPEKLVASVEHDEELSPGII